MEHTEGQQPDQYLINIAECWRKTHLIHRQRRWRAPAAMAPPLSLPPGSSETQVEILIKHWSLLLIPMLIDLIDRHTYWWSLHQSEPQWNFITFLIWSLLLISFSDWLHDQFLPTFILKVWPFPSCSWVWFLKNSNETNRSLLTADSFWSVFDQWRQTF